MATIKMTLIALLVMVAFVVAPVYAGGGAEAENDMQEGAGAYEQQEQQQPGQEREWDEERDEWDEEEDEDEWEEDEDLEQPGQQQEY